MNKMEFAAIEISKIFDKHNISTVDGIRALHAMLIAAYLKTGIPVEDYLRRSITLWDEYKKISKDILKEEKS